MKKQLVNENSLVNQVKDCTYMYCIDCITSCHQMFYDCYDNEYVCEECYRSVHFSYADYSYLEDNDDKLYVDWKKFQNLILYCETPKKGIKIFIDKILKKDFNEFDINRLLEAIKNGDKIHFF